MTNAHNNNFNNDDNDEEEEEIDNTPKRNIYELFSKENLLKEYETIAKAPKNSLN